MNILQGYLVIRLLLAVVGFGFVLIGVYVLVGHAVFDSLSAEKMYQQQYGDTWREHYLAERHTSVEEDRRKAIFGVGGLVTITTLVYLIYRQIVPRRTNRKRSRRRHHSSSVVPS